MYEIGRYVQSPTPSARPCCSKLLLPHRDRIKKLVVTPSMSIYGEGAHPAAGIHGEVDPGLRAARAAPLAPEW